LKRIPAVNLAELESQLKNVLSEKAE